MCLYDIGVRGGESVVYAVYDSRFTAPCWQRLITFDGSEIGSPSVIKNGTTWQAVPGPVNAPELGSFGAGFRMVDSFFDVFYPVQLQPSQSLDLSLGLVGQIGLGASSSGPVGGRFGVITNTVPSCYANCDQSTAPPALNVNDFICFQQRF